MNLNTIHKIWQEVKANMNSYDKSEACEAIVAILVDDDVDFEAIRTEFKGDSDMMKALEFAMGGTRLDEDEEDYFIEENEDWDDDEDDYDNESYYESI